MLNVVDGCIPSDLATGSAAGDRGGAAPALRGDDARQGPSAPVVPQRFYVTQQSRLRRPPRLRRQRTRFIPPGMADLFESRVWPEAPAQPEACPPPAEVVELLSKMKAMWS